MKMMNRLFGVHMMIKMQIETQFQSRNGGNIMVNWSKLIESQNGEEGDAARTKIPVSLNTPI